MFRPLTFAFGIFDIVGGASYDWHGASPRLAGRQEESGKWQPEAGVRWECRRGALAVLSLLNASDEVLAQLPEVARVQVSTCFRTLRSTYLNSKIAKLWCCSQSRALVQFRGRKIREP